MVSVIIPIYNVRSFIDRGLKNVLQQTYQDLEIILSDDGSTDGSYEKCLNCVNLDSRIRVLRQENMGAGAARNHGIEEARGEFIYFFDIDDEINPRLIEYCVNKMRKLNVDYICFGYENIETTFNSKVIVSFPEAVISTNAELREIFVDECVLKTNGFPWNKFYRKSFLDFHGLRYENQRIQQDEVFNLKCYQYLNKAFFSPEVFYKYYVYEKGNTRSRFIFERFDIYKSVRQHFESLKSFWHLEDSRLESYLNKRFYYSVLQCMIFNINHPKCTWTKEEKQSEMYRIMNDPLTIESFKWAEFQEPCLEQKLYRKACRAQNMGQIKLYSRLFGILHSIRKKFR